VSVSFRHPPHPLAAETEIVELLQQRLFAAVDSVGVDDNAGPAAWRWTSFRRQKGTQSLAMISFRTCRGRRRGAVGVAYHNHRALSGSASSNARIRKTSTWTFHR
jgi:hypothetical protein